MKQEISELARMLGQVANSLDRIAEILTEKGEKENPPYNPPQGKDPKRNPPTACARAREEDGFARLFDEFWAKYPKECPRKVSRKKCLAKYTSLMRNAKDSAALHAAILAGIERWRRSQDWVEDEGKFIKAPLVWLKEENWNDSPAPYTPRRTQAEREAEGREARRRAAEDARRAAAAAKPEAWALCAERCANFRDGRCTCGAKIPPQLRAHQCPPEECPSFAKKGLPAVVGEAAKSGGAA